jgi:hypothetical protein
VRCSFKKKSAVRPENLHLNSDCSLHKWCARAAIWETSPSYCRDTPYQHYLLQIVAFSSFML